MDGMKNHYQTLNIADLEQALITAAYTKLKSELVKKKSDFESPDAFNEKMSDVEEAYRVLSNKSSKMEHDLALFEAQWGVHLGELYFERHVEPLLTQAHVSHKDTTQASSSETSLDASYTSSASTLERDWELASEHFPQILQEYDRLLKFDVALAKTYQTQLHARGSYKDSTALKDQLERDFFFGIYANNIPAKAYAKKLLLSNWRAAAEKFNASLRLLGHVVSVADLIIQIEKEFEFVRNSHQHTDFFQQLKKDKCSTSSCLEFIEDFFHIKVQTQRFLFDRTFSFTIDEEDIFLHHVDDLRGFIKTHFLNYKKRDVPDNPFIMGR